MQIPKITLASASPRRKMLLEQINLAFDVIASDIEEDADLSLPPEKFAAWNAEKKALAVLDQASLPPSTLIIAADSIVVLDGDILEKPTDEAHARDMLTQLSGNRHTVFSGVCLLYMGRKITFCDRADVYMREISPAEIDAYIESGEPMDKAGSYGLQGFGAVYVKRVDGDYTTVIGLPLCALWTKMEEIING